MEKEEGTYLYELKETLITETEKAYLTAIEQALPEGYLLQPQINLASVIRRTDGFRFQNELYKNVDAGVFNKDYLPIILIEINDATHKIAERKERDEKVRAICEEAGIPLVTFWTSDGVNVAYINKRIAEGIEEAKNPIRITHSQDKKNKTENDISEKASKGKKEGCYIATAVYGGYDCPQVMILRQFRDKTLTTTFFGRTFIKCYYFVSPWLVANFSHKQGFNRFFRTKLDRLVEKLKSRELVN